MTDRKKQKVKNNAREVRGFEPIEESAPRMPCRSLPLAPRAAKYPETTC